MAKIFVLCEFTGTVRDAFVRAGHDAMSCDLLESESSGGNHYTGDCRDLDFTGVDLVVAHPPCTYLAVSGARWFNDRKLQQEESLEFVRWLLDLNVPRIALENPVSVISSRVRKPDQIIQPWMFGHGETKKTCLWLKNLPKLCPTDVVIGRESRIHRMSPGVNRGKERSRTYSGIAEAMASQWGCIL